MTSSRGRLQLVVFDDDGTIYDSLTTVVYPSIRATFELLNLKAPDLEVFRAEAEPDVAPFHYAHGVSTDITAAQMETVRQLYYSARHGSAGYRPGLEPLLKRCQEQGMYLASCSAAKHENLVGRMNLAGIYEHFDIVKGSVRPRKADGLQVIAHELHVHPADAVMVGDTVWDIEDGREAGMRTIAFAHTTSFNCKRRLAAAKPDYMVASIEELEELLVRLTPEEEEELGEVE